MPPIPGKKKPTKVEKSLVKESGPLKKWICKACKKVHWGFKKDICRNRNCKDSPFYVEGDDFICIACEGCGKSSKGGRCYPCRGTGKTGKR